MATDDAAHVKVRLRDRWQLMNPVSQREWDEDEEIQTGIRKCMNTKAQQDDVRHHRLREIRYNWKCGTSRKWQKPEKQEQLDHSEIRIQSWRWSPVPSLSFIPEECHHLLPHPLSCLMISTKILSSCLHLIHSFPTVNIQALKHTYNPVRRFSLL